MKEGELFPNFSGLDYIRNVRFMSYFKCSNLRRILKLSSSFGCLFTFCYIFGDGANSIKTDLSTHIFNLWTGHCNLQVCNLVYLICQADQQKVNKHPKFYDNFDI